MRTCSSKKTEGHSSMNPFRRMRLHSWNDFLSEVAVDVMIVSLIGVY